MVYVGPMRFRSRRIVTTLVLLCLACAIPAGEVWAQDETEGAEPATGSRFRRGSAIAVDVLLVRPLGLGKLIAGAGFACGALVLTTASTTSIRDEVVDVFHTIPRDELTDRDLGEF